MVKFLTPCDVRVFLPGLFALLAPVKVQFTRNGQEYILRVPRGFITDFASVPEMIQMIDGFEVNGGSRLPAVAHDYLYSQQGRVTCHMAYADVDVQLVLTRDECDLVLRDGLLTEGFNETVAELYYAGVRIGGQSHWDVRNPAEDFVPVNYFMENTK